MIDLIFFRMMGNFGVIPAIAAMGAFILSRIGRNDPTDENTVHQQDGEELEQEEPDGSDNDTDQR